MRKRKPTGPAHRHRWPPECRQIAPPQCLLGQERAIVSDEPGTTRDSLDTELEWEGQTITLVDTAGIRRRGKIEPGIEKYSVLRSMRAITRADVVLLVVDATEGFTSQDLHIAGYVADEARGMVLVVNKWDLVEKDGTDDGAVPRGGSGSARLHAVCPGGLHLRQVQSARPAGDGAGAPRHGRTAEARADGGAEQDAPHGG